MRGTTLACLASALLLLPISAPQKAYVLVAGTGQDPNAAMVAAQYDLLKTRILPLTKESPP